MGDDGNFVLEPTQHANWLAEVNSPKTNYNVIKAILQESNIVLTKYGTDCLTFKILDALGLPPDEMAKPQPEHH
jgi:hypothetical protein